MDRLHTAQRGLLFMDPKYWVRVKNLRPSNPGHWLHLPQIQPELWLGWQSHGL